MIGICDSIYGLAMLGNIIISPDLYKSLVVHIIVFNLCVVNLCISKVTIYLGHVLIILFKIAFISYLDFC